MDLDTLRIFAKVAELASFTRAADQLGHPKARVSTAVQQLEAQLGTRLLHRTTRSVRLTQDGEQFLERCKELLADAEELQSMFQQAPSALRGRLRVDLPVGIARSIVIPRLPEFFAVHPQLALELSTTDRLVDPVHEGFDCVLRIGALRESGLVARPLGRLRLINCASPGYLRAHGVPRTLEDLAAASAGPLLAHARRPAARMGVPRRRALPLPAHGRADHGEQLEAYEAACLAGLGLIQAPVLGLRPLIEQGLLEEVMPQATGEPMPVTLLYPHRRNLSKRVQAVLDWLAQTLGPSLH